MEHSPKYSWSLQRAPDGPLAPYIDGFKERLCALGYAETSAHLYTRLAADFSGWLKQKNVAKRSRPSIRCVTSDIVPATDAPGRAMRPR
jgi:hypothetical protein